MFPRTLLCLVAEDEPLDDARRAVEIARGANSRLSFAVVGIALPPPASIYYAVPMDAWSEERDEGLKRVKEKADELESLLQTANVSGDVSQHFVDTSAISATVGRRARYADLAVLFDETPDNRSLRSKALPGLLFESGIPLLYVPDGHARPLSLQTVMVAWNGSLEASRAVHASLDLLVAAKRVVVAMVDPVEGEWRDGEEPGSDIATYLAQHGIRVEVERLPGGGNEPAEVLLRHASSIGADLIVMGAFGHSRLREYVLGGTTLDMFGGSTTPVFLAH